MRAHISEGARIAASVLYVSFSYLSKHQCLAYKGITAYVCACGCPAYLRENVTPVSKHQPKNLWRHDPPAAGSTSASSPLSTAVLVPARKKIRDISSDGDLPCRSQTAHRKDFAHAMIVNMHPEGPKRARWRWNSHLARMIPSPCRSKGPPCRTMYRQGRPLRRSRAGGRTCSRTLFAEKKKKKVRMLV